MEKKKKRNFSLACGGKQWFDDWQSLLWAQFTLTEATIFPGKTKMAKELPDVISRVRQKSMEDENNESSQ